MATEATARISSKGQVTLPRQVRELLDSDVIRIVADDTGVHLHPVRPLAGRLKRYAAPDRMAGESAAWAQHVMDKYADS